MDIIENRCLPHYVAQHYKQRKTKTYGNTSKYLCVCTQYVGYTHIHMYIHTYYTYKHTYKNVCICTYFWDGTQIDFSHTHRRRRRVAFYLFAIVYALSNKRTNTHIDTHTHTHTLTQRVCVHVCVCRTHESAQQ